MSDVKEVDLTRWVIPGRRLLIEQESPEEQSAGGIILPDASQEELMTGRVLKLGTKIGVGPKILGYIGADISVGDRVLVSRDALRSSGCYKALGENLHIIVWETEDGGDGDVLAVYKERVGEVHDHDPAEDTTSS